MGNVISPFTISLKLHLTRTTKVITKMDIQHVPPDIVIFCKNTTFDRGISSDLLFRLMTLTDRNLNIKNYKTTNGLIKKLRNLTTGATATTASSLAVFKTPLRSRGVFYNRKCYFSCPCPCSWKGF